MRLPLHRSPLPREGVVTLMSGPDPRVQQLTDVIDGAFGTAPDFANWPRHAARMVLAWVDENTVPRARYDDKLDLIRKLSDEFVNNDTVPKQPLRDLTEQQAYWRWCWDCGATQASCQRTIDAGRDKCCPDCRHRPAELRAAIGDET